MSKEANDGRIERLEKQVEELKIQNEIIIRTLQNMPSRLEMDSVMRQQQSTSIFDIF